MSGLTRYFLRRGASAILLAFLASVLSFLLIASAPGNVATLIAEVRFPAASEADIARIEEELGLNDPLPIRYFKWVSRAVVGDFDVSLRTGKPVVEEIVNRLPETGLLVLGAGTTALLLGFAFGLGGAMVGRSADALLRTIAMLGASAPSFFVGAVLILVFAVQLRWLPSVGLGGPIAWILPFIALGLLPGMIISRVIRVQLEEAMSRPFAITARAKGFGRLRTLLVDALPNALPPLLVAFGTQFALMVQWGMVVEPIFAWQGLGTFFVHSVKFRDFTSVQACMILFAMVFIMVNLVVDLLAALADPRQRRSARIA